METYELKLEQLRLAKKITTLDKIKNPKTIGAAICINKENSLIAAVVTFSYPELTLLEKHTYTHANPLPFKADFQAYREMPAIIEAFNLLDEEPDILLVHGRGINHPRKIGLASHLGLMLNQPTIAITDKESPTTTDEIVSITFQSRPHANPLFISPGYKVSLGTTKRLVPNLMKHPHKMPEPLHIARKVAKKCTQ